MSRAASETARAPRRPAPDRDGAAQPARERDRRDRRRRSAGAQRSFCAPRRIRTSGVRITVSDSGPGLPDAMMTDVFQPFATTKLTGHGARARDQPLDRREPRRASRRTTRSRAARRSRSLSPPAKRRMRSHDHRRDRLHRRRRRAGPRLAGDAARAEGLPHTDVRGLGSVPRGVPPGVARLPGARSPHAGHERARAAGRARAARRAPAGDHRHGARRRRHDAHGAARRRRRFHRETGR